MESGHAETPRPRREEHLVEAVRRVESIVVRARILLERAVRSRAREPALDVDAGVEYVHETNDLRDDLRVENDQRPVGETGVAGEFDLIVVLEDGDL